MNERALENISRANVRRFNRNSKVRDESLKQKKAKFDRDNWDSARRILADVERYGGEESLIVRTSRAVLQHEKEAREAKRTPRGQGKLELRAAEEKTA